MMDMILPLLLGVFAIAIVWRLIKGMVKFAVLALIVLAVVFYYAGGIG